MGAADKLKSINKSIVREGFFGYAKRILFLGRYRYAIRRLFFKDRLSSNSVNIWGCALDLPARRGGIVEELLLYGIHEPVATQIYLNELQPGMKVMEVGTNIGYYLAAASSRVKENGMICGFEPDPELFEIAKKNASSIKTPTAIHPYAASDKSGFSTFHTSSVGNWGSLKNSDKLRQSGQIEVRTKSIDEFCDENNFSPDAIRMDIEGAEAAALRGAAKIIAEKKPILFIEVHKFIMNKDEYDSVIKVLLDNDYTKITAIDRYYDWPWCLKSAQRAAVRELDIKSLDLFLASPSIPNVFSIIARA